ncbi:MAG: hypothetical protein ABIN48_11755 [Ginsengibacter sp.]
MNKLAALLIMLFLFQPVFAQSKTELFDLIKKMIPDEDQPGQGMPWNTSADINQSIKWNSSLPKSNQVYNSSGKQIELWRKDGTARILLNGKDFLCENRVEGKKHSCNWSFSLFGAKTVYQGFFINVTDFPIDDPIQAIDMLFKENASVFQRYKKCIEGAVMWQDLYKVTIPGKRTVWMMVQFESLSATGPQYNNTKTDNTFTLGIYFNKEETDAECAGAPELPANPVKASSANANSKATKEETGRAQSKESTTKISSNSTTVELTQFAAVLFKDVKTNLTNKEKNDITSLSGLSANELNAQTKKGKSKYEVSVYPLDFNKDGTEEIFLCVTSKTLGIPMHTYFFYSKGNGGKYQPSPGKIGSGVKILVSGRTPFPDLITLNALSPREKWSWNGTMYRVTQTIPAGKVLSFPTRNIEEVSAEYVQRF